ncbi:hypothetical protein CDAR_534221 [Caerostris darwini]|uniref:Uncharacterized protein n=1 Tax=Caerostris darwini TaxID=1538125 RepID=A0AAV4S9M5_9ARAC|nr:hypothetical protein CDAR_534221 [Caerostris darwini]
MVKIDHLHQSETKHGRRRSLVFQQTFSQASQLRFMVVPEETQGGENAHVWGIDERGPPLLIRGTLLPEARIMDSHRVRGPRRSIDKILSNLEKKSSLIPDKRTE